MRTLRACTTLAAAAGIALLSVSISLAGGVRNPSPVEPPVLRSGELPLVFEPNVGQTDAEARFVARGRGYRLRLEPDAMVFALQSRHAAAESWMFGGSKRQSGASAAVTIRLAGARTDAELHGRNSLTCKANYLIGNDPSKWRVDIPTFAGVEARGVYPDIDAVYYGTHGSLEYDFVVAPGADPSQIELAVEGAKNVTLDDSGNLAIETSAGTLVQRAPVAYQIIAGNRVPVSAGYRIADGHRVRLVVGSYDRSRVLTIDPVISYATYLAGTGDESGTGITVDASGSAYVVGGTSSLDFPHTPGAYGTSITGATDGFVSKLTPDGSGFVFSTYIGGAGDDAIARVALDAAGNVYVCGGTSSTNYPTTPGAFRTTLAGGTYDAFVSKLNSTGTALVASTLIGGGGDDGAAGVAVSSAGEIFITGAATSSNYPTTAGAFDTSNQSLVGLPDAVVTRFNSGLTGLVYSTYLGAAFNLDAGAAIALDASGNAYVAGATNGGFPTSGGAFDTSFNGGSFDAFVTKLNPTGTGVVYSTYLGGNDEDYAFSIAIDGSGSAYVTGFTPSNNFPLQSAFQPTIGGGFDAFVTKLSSTGSALIYSSYLGGSGNEGLTSNGGTDPQIAGAIAVDGSGNAYVTGFTDSTDFPVVAAWQPHLGGGFDAFVAKINAAGSAKVYASYLGGALEERGLGIAVDSNGSAYVTGFTLSLNLATTAGVAQPAPVDTTLSAGFVAKIGNAPGDTVGIYIPSSGAWFLRTANSPGAAQAVFTYGAAGSAFVPLAGDWDGNGTATAGLYDPASSAFFLSNKNRPGSADVLFTFGAPNPDYIPIAGDWNGDGADTIGIYIRSTGTFFLRNSNDSGPADVAFSFGPGGSDFSPLVGDWNGDGTDTIGIYASSSGAFFLKNANSGGAADIVFGYGPGGGSVVPVTGDWNADGTDSIGIYAPATAAWFLRNSNSGGSADLVFTYGPSNCTPLTGHWGG